MRRARASSRGEPADRPQSTHCALRDLARLSARPTRVSFHPTPLAEALDHRHRTRLADEASNRCNRLFLVPWRASRARVAPWRTSRPPTTTHALRVACLAQLSARQTRNAPHPTPLAEAFVHRHRTRSAAAASNRRNRRFLVPWRAARARFVTWRTSRAPTEHALRAAGLGAVVCAANSRRAPPRAVDRGFFHRHRPGWRLWLRIAVAVSF